MKTISQLYPTGFLKKEVSNNLTFIDLLRNKQTILNTNLAQNEDICHLDFNDSNLFYATNKLNVMVNNYSQSRCQQFKVNNGVLDLKVDTANGYVYVLCKDQKIQKYSIKLNKVVDQVSTDNNIKQKTDVKVGRLAFIGGENDDQELMYSINKTVYSVNKTMYQEQKKMYKESRDVQFLMRCSDVVASYCGEEYLRVKKVGGQGGGIRIGLQIKGIVQQMDLQEYYKDNYILAIQYGNMVQLCLVEYIDDQQYEVKDSYELLTYNLRIENIKINRNNLIVIGIYEFKYKYKIIQQLVHNNQINRKVESQFKQIDDISILKSINNQVQGQKYKEYIQTEDAELELQQVVKKSGEREQEILKIGKIQQRINEKYPDVNIQEQSLAVLLQQSVLNKDHRIIDYVFSQSDASIIYQTVQKIDSQKIMEIMKEMVQRIEKKYIHGQQINQKQNHIVEWLRILLGVHQSVILQNVESYKILGTIKSYIMKRTQCIDRVRNIKYRLKVMNSVSQQQMLYDQQISNQKWRVEYLEDQGFKEINDVGVDDGSDDQQMFDDQFEDSCEDQDEFDQVVKHKKMDRSGAGQMDEEFSDDLDKDYLQFE